MKAALISLGSTSSQWTADEMKKLFDEVDVLNIKQIEVILGSKSGQVLHEGKPLPKYDCIYAKGSFRYANLLHSLSSILEEKTYMPLASFAWTNGHDKLLTHLCLEKAGIPMPETYLSSTPEAAKKLLEQITYPIILKLPKGTHGKGVMFAESYAAASSMLDALSALNQPFIIQEFIPASGEDIRAFVVGDEVIAAMKRVAAEGEQRANIHAGGSAIPITLDLHSQKIAIRAAKALNSDVCAVDMMMSIKGPVVIELNTSPGLQGITKATGINVAEKIAKFLYKKAKEKNTEHKDVTTKEIFDELGLNKPKKKINNGVQNIISELDFRGEKILLSEIITKTAKFKPDQEYTINVKEGQLEIKKFEVGKKN